MKPRFRPSVLISSITLALFASPCVLAQTLVWDSNGDTVGSGATPTGTWGLDPFWNTTGTGDVTIPTNATTNRFNDLAFCAGTDAIGAYTVTVNGTQNAKNIAFQDGEPTLAGGSIILAAGGGLSVNSTAALAGATVTSNLSISGRTSFAIGSTGGLRTLNLNTGTLTRNPGAVLLVTSGGNLVSTMTGLSSNTNGIVGPWVTYGTGATTQYATFSGSSIVGLTGTAAATAANVTDTTGAFNYEVAAVGTLGANASVNTLRYTGAAGTINTSGSFTLNGLLSISANALTVAGNVTIGSTNELVVNNPVSSGTITLSGNIGNNGSNTSSLIKTGAGVLTLSGNNTYSGDTMIVGSAGGIVVTANNSLGTTAGTTTVMPFTTTGNSLGFSGGINYSTAETIIGSGVGTSNLGSFVATQRGFVQSVSGNNTFAGAIQINAGGTSRIGAQDGAQLTLSGPITMAGGTTGVTVVLRAGNTNGDFITLTNSGNSWDTQTLIFTSNAGTGAGVRLGVNNAFPTGASLGALATSSAGTTLDLAGFSQEVNGLVIDTGSTSLKITNSAAATTSVLTLNTTANRGFNPGGVIQDGAGVIQVVKTGSADQSLQGVHTYTGGTLIKNGSITLLTGNDRLPATGTVTLGDTGSTGKLVLGSLGFPRNQTLAALLTSGDGGSVVGADAATDSVLTLNTATSNAFSGALGGVGTNEDKLALLKTGAGTLTLSGANTYTGATTISAGTLALGANNALSDLTPVSIGAATLDAATFDDSVGTLAVTAAASINLGAGVNLVFADSNLADWTGGTLNITGTFVSGSSIKFATNGGLTAPQLAVISVNGSGLGTYTLDASGYLVAPGGNTVPTISDIADQSVPSGGNTGALVLTVGDAETAVGSLIVTGSSSNLALVPNGNIVIGGSGASRTVTVTPVSGLSGTATITVTVDDGSLTATDTFVLTVTDNYLSWSTANGVTGGSNGDSDNDGVTNLVEYALVNGGERGVLSGNTITFTKRGAPYSSDATYGIVTSTDLVVWGTPGSGVTENATTISYTFTPGSPVKNFARLKVVQVP